MTEETNQSIQFSPLIVGCMRLGAWGAQLSTEALQAFIEDCLEMGLRDFDHADIYGHYTTEEEFGKVLKRQPQLREQMQITTKCGIKLVTENRPTHQLKSYDLGKEHILQSVDQSLKALETDYIDILLLHRPDILFDPSEIAEVFQQLKDSGKVRHFGVSNFTASQFDLLNTFTPLMTNQLEISALHLNAFQDATLDQCLKLGIRPTAWSPLGGGAIFGKKPDARAQRIQKVGGKLCEKYNATLDQILIAWLARHPSGIIPVTGSSRIERLRSAKEAMNLKLTREEWYEIWQASTGEEVA